LNLTFCSDDFRVQGRPLRIAPVLLPANLASQGLVF
jgi:hypothetical protein